MPETEDKSTMLEKKAIERRWVDPASEDRLGKTPKMQGFLDRVLLSRPT